MDKRQAVKWSVDPEDWKLRNTEKDVAAVLRAVQPGDIILCLLYTSGHWQRTLFGDSIAYRRGRGQEGWGKMGGYGGKKKEVHCLGQWTAFLFGVRSLDQLDHSGLGGVAPADAGAGDAGVTAVALRVAGGQLLEDLLADVLTGDEAHEMCIRDRRS